MVYIILLSFLTPLLIWAGFIVTADHSDRRTVVTNGLWILVILLILKAIQTYAWLPSRNPLSLLGANLIWGAAILLALYLLCRVNTNSSFLRTTLAAGGLLVILLVVVAGGEAHSAFSVKPVAKSIQSKKISSKEAPTFKRGVTPVALSPKTVKNRMNKNMSDVPNSQYFHLGDIQAQYYHGKPVYIAPVEFDGFFKYMSAKQRTPGYFIIDATSVSAEPKFVRKSMKYTNASYFNNNAQRHIYQDYPQWLVADNSEPQLEVDENGTPYYIETTYKSMALSHRINYSKLHVIAVNAITGKTNLYALKNLPKWIDEGITSDVADYMNTAYGKYQRGWLNMHLSKTGIQVPTNSEVISTFDRQGNVQYFTDFTNPRSDADSALGYSMINARTGQLVYYKTHGIMDSDGARNNADNNYKAQQWKSSMPVIYNINGKPTWVLSILDSTSAFRGYYYIDAADQSVHATGNNANEAVDNFRQALVDSGASAGNTAGTKLKTITGTVARAVLATKGSNQVLLFTLSGSNTVYTADGDDFQKALLTQAGDKVRLKAYVVNGKSVGNVEKFTNLNLK
ncbi:hypothetical protein [Pediococcus ethanolidurans]|uniref:DNA-binding protein n=1 Tax=Pediococcus ethanolidurans TaxID=319653 RepID=A0A1H9TJ52_9LACO|nr:hypothetical protein [Pediococcus ethanolidurans]GEN96094.1 hypothetical protein PET01_21440 [Pediococcus ethanolidurans]SER97138.1 hypothetical protein SAMN04487973_1383 [Pediococcus ethanolidurans]